MLNSVWTDEITPEICSMSVYRPVMTGERNPSRPIAASAFPVATNSSVSSAPLPVTNLTFGRVGRNFASNGLYSGTATVWPSSSPSSTMRGEPVCVTIMVALT
ncbi:hypothetical protein D3C72_1597650 [compost metagenome]